MTPSSSERSGRRGRIARTDRLLTVAALAWLAAPVQFLVVHVVVQSAWPTPYSWAANNVSDLGNTTCQVWDGRQVCSPLHAVQNASFVLTGVLVWLGVVSLTAARRRWPSASQWCLVVAAAGWALAGLAPADVDEDLHLLAALGIFLASNAGLLLVVAERGPAPWAPRLGWAALALGLVGFTATALFLAGTDLGIGPGGMERVAAYGVLVWMVIAATSVLHRRSAGRRRRISTT